MLLKRWQDGVVKSMNARPPLVQAPPLNVMGSGGAEQVSRLLTTSELFRVFGVRPVLGREFTDEETRPGNHDVVILGYGFWQRWFAGDPGVVDLSPDQWRQVPDERIPHKPSRGQD